jgi:hypothetical protein
MSALLRLPVALAAAALAYPCGAHAEDGPVILLPLRTMEPISPEERAAAASALEESVRRAEFQYVWFSKWVTSRTAERCTERPSQRHRCVVGQCGEHARCSAARLVNGAGAPFGLDVWITPSRVFAAYVTDRHTGNHYSVARSEDLRASVGDAVDELLERRRVDLESTARWQEDIAQRDAVAGGRESPSGTVVLGALGTAAGAGLIVGGALMMDSRDDIRGGVTLLVLLLDAYAGVHD